MRRLTMLITILATIVAFSTASAAYHNDRLSVNLTAGAVANVSSGDRADLFPSGFAATGDLYYKMNEHVSLMPVSLVWHVYSYDQNVNSVTNGVVNSLPADISDTPPSVLDVEGSAWGVGLLPGLYFESGGDHRFNVLGQVGIGAYRYEETFTVFEIDRSVNETGFASRVAAGIDYRLADRANMRLSTGYFYTNTDQARDNMLDFNVGVKYMF